MPATSESAQFAAAAAAGAAPGRRKRGRPSRTSAARGVAEMVERELGSGDDNSQAGAAPPTVRHRVSQTSWIWFFFSPTKGPVEVLLSNVRLGGHCEEGRPLHHGGTVERCAVDKQPHRPHSSGPFCVGGQDR